MGFRLSGVAIWGDGGKAAIGMGEIVMRVYFGKPRTTISRKGLSDDARLDGRDEMNNGSSPSTLRM